MMRPASETSAAATAASPPNRMATLGLRIDITSPMPRASSVLASSIMASIRERLGGPS